MAILGQAGKVSEFAKSAPANTSDSHANREIQAATAAVNAGKLAANSSAATAKSTAAIAANNKLEGVHNKIPPPPSITNHPAGKSSDPDRASSAVGTASSGPTKMLDHSKPNQLEQYASYTPLWTMAVLTPDEFNEPSSYRNSKTFKNVILSSAGRYDDERVQTAYGKPEYFITDFNSQAAVAPNAKVGNTYAFKYEFDVFEPYSMGLFLQSLQVASAKAGYGNHLSAPYVIKLEFKGFNDQGKPLSSGVAPKFFVFKLTKVGFTVTESGSKYNVEAVPYNQSAYSDVSITVENDVTLVVDNEYTVEEMLSTGKESLEAALNKIEQKLVEKDRVDIPNKYHIQFPIPTPSMGAAPASLAAAESRATVVPGISAKHDAVSSDVTRPNPGCNKIGKADFGFTVDNGGIYPFVKEDNKHESDGVYKYENLTIEPAARKFHFSQGQSVITIINEVIKNSTYIPAALKDRPDGFITYFRIDVQVLLLDEDKKRGERAKDITYNIMMYDVHESIDSNPQSAPKGYDIIKNAIVKEYNYIYTGQNVDVLDFEIKIDNLFYIGLNSSSEDQNATTSNRDSGGPTEATENHAEVTVGPNTTAPKTDLGRATAKSNPKSQQSTSGGSSIESVEGQIAEILHRNIVDGTSADLINLELKILGDPYWLSDSGVANHSAAVPHPAQITGDMAMNYESGDIFVYVTFRTPNDVLEKQGLYDYGTGSKDSSFSGIYRVTLCESSFNNGLFTQVLKGVRMIGQDYDYVDAVGSVGSKSDVETVKTHVQLEDRSSITSGPKS